MVRYKINNPEKNSEDLLEHVSGGMSPETCKKFKNIAVGVSAIAIALSAVTVAYSVSNNINKSSKNVENKLDQTGNSWLGWAMG